MITARYSDYNWVVFQDLFNMQDAGGQPPSAALITLNQMGAQIATVKRRKKSTAAPDKKKMYEEVGCI